MFRIEVTVVLYCIILIVNMLIIKDSLPNFWHSPESFRFSFQTATTPRTWCAQTVWEQTDRTLCPLCIHKLLVICLHPEPFHFQCLFVSFCPCSVSMLLLSKQTLELTSSKRLAANIRSTWGPETWRLSFIPTTVCTSSTRVEINPHLAYIV